MADNYLEKKMEEFKAMPPAGVASKNSRKQATTLSKLVAANKFCKSFNNSIIVREQHLKDLINFVLEHNSNVCSSSAKLHYYPTINNTEVSTILDLLKKQNPHLLDFENTEYLPKSFILIGCNRPADPNSLYFQLGAISNTITLRATEMGLNGSYALLQNQNELTDSLNLTFIPLIAVAIGNGE